MLSQQLNITTYLINLITNNMSLKNNDKFEEHVLESFRIAVEHRDWKLANEIYLETKDKDEFLAKKLWATLTDEELEDYKKFN